MEGTQTVQWMDIQTEFLLILQDFLPYKGRCPERDKPFQNALRAPLQDKRVAKRHHEVIGSLALICLCCEIYEGSRAAAPTGNKVL